MKMPLATLCTLFSLYLSTPGNKTARLAQITPQSKCPLLFMARWTLFQMKESGVAQRCPRIALGRPETMQLLKTFGLICRIPAPESCSL